MHSHQHITKVHEPDQARTGSRKEYANRILSTTLLRSSCVASTGSVMMTHCASLTLSKRQTKTAATSPYRTFPSVEHAPGKCSRGSTALSVFTRHGRRGTSGRSPGDGELPGP